MGHRDPRVNRAAPRTADTGRSDTTARLTELDLVAAPVAGRVCSTGLAIAPEVTETLVAYDDANRSLTYEAAGMPSFVTTARNTWTVTPLDDDTCVVTLDAQFDTRGIVGTLARWVMLAQLGRTSQHLGDDLRHFVENGRPSPRKQRQLRQGEPSPTADSDQSTMERAMRNPTSSS